MSKFLNDITRNLYLANCLCDCIEDNNIRAVKKLLIETGANPNTLIPDKGITPFHFAIGSGDETIAEEMTNLFLDCGGNPNVRSTEMLTPVHVAAAWGRLKVLKALLESGGDPTLTDEENQTPLDYAKSENYLHVINYLENTLEITFNKIISNNTATRTEYEVANVNDITKKSNFKFPKNLTKSYVNNWCITHSNIIHENATVTNDNLNENREINLTSETITKNLNILNSEEDNNSYSNISSDSIAHKNYSKESGIVTISSSSTDNISNENIQSNNTEYLSCDSINTFEKNINSSLITLDLSELPNQNSNLNITSDKSIDILEKNNIINEIKVLDEQESAISVEEEYKYVDTDQGIVLIERRILVNPKIDDNRSTISDSSKISSVPSVINYDTDTLRHELTSRGEPPGPITVTTKRVYLKKLKKLEKSTVLEPPVMKNERVYSVELEKTIRTPNWTTDLTSYKALESVVVNQFSKPEPAKRWREGITKASFTYLLLDPRITLNLPLKSSELSEDEIWKTFLSAIFYVGKGKRSRPYSHLYEAVHYWKKGQTSHGDNKKINYILDIWQNNYGVVCLHIFQNVIPVEAYTREAAMIKALKLQNLCNAKLGDFYGISSTWPERKKRLLGVYLLYRAMLIFLNEGERQLRPDDIG